MLTALAGWSYWPAADLTEETRMQIEDEPNLVTSGKSQRVMVDGCTFSIEIYRLAADSHWTLEVVDHENTSHVWDDQFASDEDACTAALRALEEEGATSFMRGNNVVPFSRET